MSSVWLVALSLVSLAADPVPEPEDVRPGWIALVTVLLLCGASLLLWFSMRKQLRRIQVPREGEDAAPTTQPTTQPPTQPTPDDER